MTDVIWARIVAVLVFIIFLIEPFALIHIAFGFTIATALSEINILELVNKWDRLIRGECDGS